MREVFFVSVITGVVMGSIVAIALYVTRMNCRTTAELMEMRYRYVSGAGCMVMTTTGRWVPLRALKVVVR